MKKSSAEDKPKGRLEDVFRQQFEQAEVRPPADLWSRLEHDLDVEEKNTYRQGMLRYRNIAAAALLLLIASVTLLTHNLLNKPETLGDLATATKPAIVKQADAVETQQPAYSENSSDVGVAGENKPGSAPGSVALNPETENSENEAIRDKILKDEASEKAIPSASQKLPQYAHRPGQKSRSEKKAANKGIFKPREERPAAVAIGQRPAVASAVKPARPSETELHVNQEPVVAVAAKKANEGEPGAAVRKDDQAAVANRTTSQTATPDAAAYSGKVTETGMPANPEKTSVLAADQEKNAAKSMAEAGLAKTETAEPDTSKQQLQQLAIAPEQEKEVVKKDKPKAEPSKWMLVASLTPQTFKQNIMLRTDNSGGLFEMKKDVSTTAVPDNYADAITDYEQNTHSAFSYQAQIGAGYRVRPKWILQAGLGFMQNKAKSVANYTVRPVSIGAGSGNPGTLVQDEGVPVFSALILAQADTNVTVVSTAPYSVHYRYRYFQIPVQVTYEGSRKNWSYLLSAGFAANWMLSQKFSDERKPDQPSTRLQSGNSYSAGEFNWFLPQALAGAKVAYTVNEHWQLLAGPSIAVGLRTLIKEKKDDASFSPNSLQTRSYTEEVEQKVPVNLGLTVGVSYNFIPKN